MPRIARDRRGMSTSEIPSAAATKAAASDVPSSGSIVLPSRSKSSNWSGSMRLPSSSASANTFKSNSFKSLMPDEEMNSPKFAFITLRASCICIIASFNAI